MSDISKYLNQVIQGDCLEVFYELNDELNGYDDFIYCKTAESAFYFFSTNQNLKLVL